MAGVERGSSGETVNTRALKRMKSHFDAIARIDPDNPLDPQKPSDVTAGSSMPFIPPKFDTRFQPHREG